MAKKLNIFSIIKITGKFLKMMVESEGNWSDYGLILLSIGKDS